MYLLIPEEISHSADGKKENKERCIIKFGLQLWNKIFANPLTDSAFKSQYIFLRHIILTLPHAFYSDNLRSFTCQTEKNDK